MSTPNSRSGIFDGIQHRAMGVAFLLLVALFAYGTYAIFNKTFAQYDNVTLLSSKAGLQLPDRADVKIRGVQVGEVTAMKADGDKVALTLGLYPSQSETVPANATARILPKTLFGEKYVALQVPEDPQGSIEAGDEITESRVAIEVEKVLADLYPLLRTVQPEQLNYTLTAMATALEGRGEQLGNNLVVLDDYLKRMNPKIPLLIDDLNKLATVSDAYTEAVPDLANLLRNSVTTGNTFVEKEAKVSALFNDVASFSSTSKDFLETNGENIIRLSKQGQRQLPLFAKYAPEYPCLLRGIVNVIPRQEEAFRGYTLHIDLETLPRQPRGYNPGDKPVYAERGENAVDLGDCRDAINDRYGQRNLPPKSLVPNIKDGVNYPVGKERPATGFDVSSGYAGSAAEQTVVDSIAAPVMGLRPEQVPDLATLLFAPLARGTEVSLR